MGRFLLVCLGGAVGSGARFALSVAFRFLLGAAFPYGTLAVNVIGSFLLGLIMQLGIADEILSPAARLTLGTGVMGGFTTYSSFNYETLQLLRDRAFFLAFANVVITLSACFVAGWMGLAVARRLTHV
jgi:CrcB protein